MNGTIRAADACLRRVSRRAVRAVARPEPAQAALDAARFGGRGRRRAHAAARANRRLLLLWYIHAPGLRGTGGAPRLLRRFFPRVTDATQLTKFPRKRGLMPNATGRPRGATEFTAGVTRNEQGGAPYSRMPKPVTEPSGCPPRLKFAIRDDHATAGRADEWVRTKCRIVLRDNIQYFSHTSPASYRPKNIGPICIPLRIIDICKKTSENPTVQALGFISILNKADEMFMFLIPFAQAAAAIIRTPVFGRTAIR